MNVLINALQAGNRSGTGRYTEELVRALAALKDGPELSVVWPADGAVPDFGSRVTLLRRPATAFRRLMADHWDVLELATRQGAQVVHYPANFGPLVAVRNLVVTVHDLSFVRHPEWFRLDRAVYYRWMLKRSTRRAKRFIADSQATANDLRDFLHMPEDRIDVIPLGVNPVFQPASGAACAAVRKKYRLPERFILYVGTMEPRKNLSRVIAAWACIAGEQMPDLVVAGRVGWKTGAIQTMVARCPRKDHIHFPGFIAAEDLPALLSSAHALVWPSLFEGFGLPPLEAMACGTPVITSNTSSLPEVVGDAALMVPPEDVEAIGDALRRIATDDALHARLRQQGLERAAAFTWERTARMTLESYERAFA